MVKTGPTAKSAGHRVEHVPEIGSTSAELFARARKGETGPLWLVADIQTTGKGRQARHWDSPKGNLYASLLLTDPAPSETVAQLSFVLSLALRDAVLVAAGLADDPALTLKWPNDLMAEGRKCAGLLLEGGRHDKTPFVVAGMGVNILSHPKGTTHPATDLQAAGYRTDRDALFSALANTVAGRLAQWKRGENFAAIRADWLALAFGRGSRLRVNLVGESFEGVFEDLDEQGRLLIATPDGARAVSAGEVFALRGALLEAGA